MIKVMIIEDSPTCRELLKMVLQTDDGIKVASEFSNAEDAIKAMKEQKPDIITMDINLPGISGLEATALIMETNPIPIILLSNEFEKETMFTTFDALKSGALTALKKPPAPDSETFPGYSKNLIFQVKALSDIRLVTRKKKKFEIDQKAERFPDKTQTPIVAIGASTGGPPVIQEILQGLNRNFAFPILFVQHISSGFVGGMVEWLRNTTEINVELGRDGQMALSGNLYIAPDDFHMTVDANGLIHLSKDPVCQKPRPSVSTLFSSVASNFGSNAIGIVLTGMGKDGTEGLKEMRNNGALTIAQNEESCGVFGMPKAAIERGGVKMILSPSEIVTNLLEISAEFKGEFGRKTDFLEICQKLCRMESI